MTTEIVRYGQTIFDISVWKYGTLQQISRFVRDNGGNYDQALLQGDEVLINSDLEIGKYFVRMFFEQAQFIPTSGVDNVRIITNFVFKSGANFVFKSGANFIFKK